MLASWPGHCGSSRRPWRIGLPVQVDEVTLQAPVAAAWQAAQQALTRAGARLVPVAVPAWQPLVLRRAALLLSEMEASAWWTQRLGEGLPGLSEGLQAMLRFPQTLGEDKRERARSMVQAVRDQAAQVFDEVDLLLLPTTPQPAFAHGAPVPPDQGDFTTLANAMGCAALSCPVPVPGGASDALPVGCQLLGPRGSAGGERPERAERMERMERMEQVDRAERAGRAGLAHRGERPDRVDQPMPQRPS
jgi:aspartyl-tRNA(Asn)/glutamyl-tRNA(Gln) amidotransferase subunit A